MSWTPNVTGLDSEPHAFSSILGGVLPFTPFAGNRGELLPPSTVVESVMLTFSPVLQPVPESCLVESIKRIWVNGPELVSGLVSAAGGWSIQDVTALINWPGTTVELISPEDFEGLAVLVNFGGAQVTRVLAQTEWRGDTGEVFVEVGGGDLPE